MEEDSPSPPTSLAEALVPSIPFYKTIWVSGSKAPGIDSRHAHAPHCPSNRRPPLTKERTFYNTVDQQAEPSTQRSKFEQRMERLINMSQQIKDIEGQNNLEKTDSITGNSME
ncbi:hypothetical protein HNY73_004643 [Argiope bruennichi]|uniref:Uncharacterized protein n=1 Tax=Argiope bruennichi TaxID=94029 RepID=A0A8T0FUA4_ARGBR|nr:hypothetical protein HNY73_004643 [Argiope bruennichi]